MHLDQTSSVVIFLTVLNMTLRVVVSSEELAHTKPNLLRKMLDFVEM